MTQNKKESKRNGYEYKWRAGEKLSTHKVYNKKQERSYLEQLAITL